MKIGDVINFLWDDGERRTGIVAQYDPEIGATIVDANDPEDKMICLSADTHSDIFCEYIEYIDSYPLVNVEVLDDIAGENAEGGWVVCAFGG